MKTQKPSYDIKNITDRLVNSSTSDRLNALDEIAGFRLSELLETSIQVMLTDPSPEVRERAAWAIDNLKDNRALPAFLKAIYDEEYGVRSAAGWGLVHLGSQVIPYIKEILATSSHTGARDMASLVLKHL